MFKGDLSEDMTVRDVSFDGINVNGDFTVGDRVERYKPLDQCDQIELGEEERLSLLYIREKEVKRANFAITALVGAVGVAGLVWLLSFFFASLDAQVSNGIAFVTLLVTVRTALEADRPKIEELEEKERLRLIRSLIDRRNFAGRHSR